MKIDYHNNTLIITLYETDNLDVIHSVLDEMKRFLCKKINVDDSNFEEHKEIHIDVDDYYEYQAYRRLIYNYCSI